MFQYLIKNVMHNHVIQYNLIKPELHFNKLNPNKLDKIFLEY